MINSHEKAWAVRDASKKATLRASLQERLRNSRNIIVIIGETTRLDTDRVPFEIEQAVDTYGIPLIAAYTDYQYIMAPAELRPLWPKALEKRIDNKTARAIHIPFKKAPIMDAIGQFSHAKLPNTALSYYNREA